MKIFFILVALAFATPTVFSQIDLKKAASAATALGFDPVKIGKSIMDQLIPKLGLNGDQIAKVASIINQFLVNKSSYAGLMQSEPSEYKTKFAADQKTLLNGLKGVLKPAQFTQFMGLKPKQADAANAISQLFY